MRLASVVLERTSTVVAEAVAVADTFSTRLTGLLGMRQLPLGGGLWMLPSRGAHTIGMRFAIDVLSLDRELRVLATWEHVPPQRLTGLKLRAHSVLELAAGEIARNSLRVGDVLQISAQ